MQAGGDEKKKKWNGDEGYCWEVGRRAGKGGEKRDSIVIVSRSTSPNSSFVGDSSVKLKQNRVQTHKKKAAARENKKRR